MRRGLRLQEIDIPERERRMKSEIKSKNPITFEIISHRLHQIAKETGITLERVGGTVNTTQQRDYMAALYRANGDLLSAGDTMGQHVACAGFAAGRKSLKHRSCSRIARTLLNGCLSLPYKPR